MGIRIGWDMIKYKNTAAPLYVYLLNIPGAINVAEVITPDQVKKQIAKTNDLFNYLSGSRFSLNLTDVIEQPLDSIDIDALQGIATDKEGFNLFVGLPIESGGDGYLEKGLILVSSLRLTQASPLSYKVLAHEVGHGLLGDHCSVRKCLMSKYVRTDSWLYLCEDDAGALDWPHKKPLDLSLEMRM